METKTLLTKNDILLTLQESWLRLNQKSPKFFRVIGWISIIMACIGFIPDVLTYIDVVLPESWMKIVGHCMKAAGIWGKLMASLPVSNAKPAIMPFTEKKQIEQEIKATQSIN